MPGKLTVEAQRCKLLFTGEGRNGKTSTRKALTYAPFDAAEASTCGTKVDDFGLVIDRHEARDWMPYAARDSNEHRRGLARLVADVLSGKMSLEVLAAQGVSGGLLRLLQDKLAAQKQNDTMA